MSKPKYVYVTYIAAPIQKVWEALTSEEYTRQYWGGHSLQTDWKVGSPVTRLERDGSVNWMGEVLEFKSPERLSYTFDVVSEGEREKPSRVLFELEQLASSVRLTVTHDDFEETSQIFHGIQHGWPMILSNLKTVIETGSAMAMSCKE